MKLIGLGKFFGSMQMVPVNLPEGKHPILTVGSSDPEEETRLYISNLDYDVSNSDMEVTNSSCFSLFK